MVNEMHKLRRKTEASAEGYVDDLGLHFEPLELVELGFLLSADVRIEPEFAVAELSDEQGQVAVALQIGDKRRRVAHVHVDRLTSGLNLNRRRQLGRYWISYRQQHGYDAPPHYDSYCQFL